MAEILFRIGKKESSVLTKYDVNVFCPRIGQLTIKGEKISVISWLVRLYFCCISKNKMKIYYVCDQHNKVIHISSVLPHNLKFRFLKDRECIIGPCYTSSERRGEGIYPYVLNYIVSTYDADYFYMVVSEENKSSYKGVKNAGFVECGTVHITRFLKQYQKK